MSMSDKYDSVYERTQEISKLMKLHIRGWQNAHKFIRQLAHCLERLVYRHDVLYIEWFAGCMLIGVDQHSPT